MKQSAVNMSGFTQSVIATRQGQDIRDTMYIIDESHSRNDAPETGQSRGTAHTDA
jgi:hypothetical protein